MVMPGVRVLTSLDLHPPDAWHDSIFSWRLPALMCKWKNVFGMLDGIDYSIMASSLEPAANKLPGGPSPCMQQWRAAQAWFFPSAPEPVDCSESPRSAFQRLWASQQGLDYAPCDAHSSPQGKPPEVTTEELQSKQVSDTWTTGNNAAFMHRNPCQSKQSLANTCSRLLSGRLHVRGCLSIKMLCHTDCICRATLPLRTILLFLELAIVSCNRSGLIVCIGSSHLD